MDEPIYCFTWN
eukprot:gene14760-10556_t